MTPAFTRFQVFQPVPSFRSTAPSLNDCDSAVRVLQAPQLRSVLVQPRHPLAPCARCASRFITLKRKEFKQNLIVPGTSQTSGRAWAPSGHLLAPAPPNATVGTCAPAWAIPRAANAGAAIAGPGIDRFTCLASSGRSAWRHSALNGARWNHARLGCGGSRASRINSFAVMLVAVSLRCTISRFESPTA
jgi:hypothetical protein